MANETAIDILLDLTTKGVTITGDAIAVKEKVDVVIDGVGTITPTSIKLQIRTPDSTNTFLAGLATWVDAGTTWTGELDLNSVPLVAQFASSKTYQSKTFALVVWDDTEKDLLANSLITIMNNPYDAT